MFSVLKILRKNPREQAHEFPAPSSQRFFGRILASKPTKFPGSSSQRFFGRIFATREVQVRAFRRIRDWIGGP
jgi:hypothetical protein